MQGISGNAVRVEVGMKLALEVPSALTPVWRETGFQALVLASCSAVRALLACFHHYTYHPYPGHSNGACVECLAPGQRPPSPCSYTHLLPGSQLCVKRAYAPARAVLTLIIYCGSSAIKTHQSRQVTRRWLTDTAS